MRRRTLIPIVAVCGVLVLGWASWPTLVVASMHLAAKKGEESSRRVCDRIVAVGERAIPAIISSIEANSPWVRRHCYLPIALREIGGTAHAQLRQAIGRQRDPVKRIYLISALQTAFDDYSEVGTFLADFKDTDYFPSVQRRMALDLRMRFPDAPPLLSDDHQLNVEFVNYWKQRDLIE